MGPFRALLVACAVAMPCWAEPAAAKAVSPQAPRQQLADAKARATRAEQDAAKERSVMQQKLAALEKALADLRQRADVAEREGDDARRANASLEVLLQELRTDLDQALATNSNLSRLFGNERAKNRTLTTHADRRSKNLQTEVQAQRDTAERLRGELDTIRWQIEHVGWLLAATAVLGLGTGALAARWLWPAKVPTAPVPAPHIAVAGSRLSINRVVPSLAAASTTSASPVFGSARSARRRIAT